MEARVPIPMPLKLVALAIVAECTVLLLLRSVTVAAVLLVMAEIVLLWLLLRGSRLCWTLLVLGSLVQLIGPFLWAEPYWTIAPGVIFLACLLAPPSRDFVWGQKGPGTSVSRMPLGIYSSIEATLVSGRANLLNERHLKFVNGETIGGLAIVLFIAIPLMGRFTAYREDADSFLIDLVWRALWIPFNLLPVAIITLLGLLAYRRWKVRNHPATQ
jgi:hypothetical protein